MLLIAAWRRLLVAGVAVAGLWAAVLWVAPSTPSTAPAQPSLRVPAQPADVPVSETGALRAVVRSGLAAPGGGRFDRFDITSQPIVAPVNARGQVAFFATVLRVPAREGIFLAEAGQVTKVAAFGDSLPGGGTLAEFGVHPLPSLNNAGHVAFEAQIAGGRATEGVFLAGADGLQAIALAGDDAPGVAQGVWSGSMAGPGRLPPSRGPRAVSGRSRQWARRCRRALQSGVSYSMRSPWQDRAGR